MPAQAWVTLVVGVVGFAGVIASMIQRTYADRRAEWWRRATWAVDHTLSENIDAQVLGFDVLARLQSSALVTKTEADMFSEWGRIRLFETGGPDDSTAQQAHTGSEEDR